MPRAHLITRLRSTAVLAVLAAVSLWLSAGSTSPAAAALASLWQRGTDAPGATAGAAMVNVAVGDTWFCDPSFLNGVCDVAVDVGGTVRWDFMGASLTHSSTECGASCDTPTTMPLWDSGLIRPASASRTFDRTFTDPGVFLYRCQVHPLQMRGRVIVGGVVPTSTPRPTPTLTPMPGGQAGDVDKNGAVNAIDAALVLQHSAGLLPSVNPNADVNGDGRIDAIDAALILQFVAGLIPRLPPPGAGLGPIFYP